MMRRLFPGGFVPFLALFLVYWLLGFIWGPQTSYAESSCSGDFYIDGDVDGLDLAMFSDLYGDGLVNEANLAALALSFGKTDCLVEPAQVQFKEVRSSAEEGASVPVVLVLSRPFAGQITLEVSGTAGEQDHGLTCSGFECTASVTGFAEATLQVPITDDMDIEELEWLGIRLKPTADYEVGALGEHVISLEDNDAVWEGLFSSKGEELGFSIEILRSGATVTATLLTEGGGIIPSGASSLDPADRQFNLFFNLDSKIFSGDLPAVPLAKEDTLLGTDGALWLELEASESTGGVSSERVEGRQDLGSTSRMRVQYTGQPHLDSDVLGSFVLQRRPAKPSSAEVPLEPSY